MPSSSEAVSPASGRQPESRWRRAVVYLPAFALSLIACLQLTLSHRSTLVPWKGGGFGMFSSVDSDSSRVARGYLIADSGRKYPIRIGDELDLELPKAVAYPTRPRLTRLASRMLRMSWTLDEPTGAAVPRPERSRAQRLRAKDIRLEVLRVQFDRQSREAKLTLLAEFDSSLNER